MLAEKGDDADSFVTLAFLPSNAPAIHRGSFGSMEFCFETKGISYRLITKLIEGNYPGYRQVIPVDHKCSAMFDRGELITALKIVGTACTDKCNSVKLVSDGDGWMHFSAKSPDKGEAKQSLPCNPDVKIAIALNTDSYVVPVLEALSVPRVKLEFTDELSPMSLTIPGEAHQNYHMVVMPMRLS